jgi:predicted amidohydrolase
MKKLQLAVLILLLSLGFLVSAKVVPIQEVFMPPGNFPKDKFWKVAAIHWTPYDSPANANSYEAMAHKQKNWRALESRITQAARNGAQFIASPEMATVGYPAAGDYEDRTEIAPFAEPIPGPTTHYFAKVAYKLSVYLMIPVAEAESATGRFFNSMVVISPQGQILTQYRKQNLFGNEPAYFSAGNQAATFASPVGAIGVMICADTYDSRVVSQYRNLGVKIISMGAAWTVANSGMNAFRRSARSVGSYMIASNQSFAPDAGIISPDGSIQSHIRQTRDGIAYGFIPLVSKYRSP